MENNDIDNSEKLRNEEYFDRSGCGSIAAALGIIALFWIVVGCIYLFTKIKTT